MLIEIFFIPYNEYLLQAFKILDHSFLTSLIHLNIILLFSKL